MRKRLIPIITALVLLLSAVWTSPVFGDYKEVSTSTNVNIPDGGTVTQSLVVSGAPSWARVSKVTYRIRIDDRGDPFTFFCADYEIYLTSGAHSSNVLVYNHLGGSLDGGHDDDPENDSDIYLNWRTTHDFDGEPVNQTYSAIIKDTWWVDYGLVDYVEFRVYWELQADLSCEDLNISANPPVGGESLQTSVTIRNAGPASAFREPLLAHMPQPANGATDADDHPALTWTAGSQAARHKVYFGTNPASPSYRRQQTSTSYNPGTLQWGQTYYWRIDGVRSNGTTIAGKLWQFTVADYLVVDDFEGYTAWSPDRIFDAWTDGATDLQNGSWIGYLDAPYVERNSVHEGAQSMPFAYDNGQYSYVSQGGRTFSSSQNWTRDGVDVLTLWYKGIAPGSFTSQPGNVHLISAQGVDIWETTGSVSGSWTSRDIGIVPNAPEPMYVQLADAGGTLRANVVSMNLDRVLGGYWQPWNIPLENFSGGLDLTRIKHLRIGMGDPGRPQSGGSGRIYFDDIRLRRMAQQAIWIPGEEAPQNWRMTSDPDTGDVIHLSGPLDIVYEKRAVAEQNMGIPKIKVDTVQETVELVFEPPAAPVCVGGHYDPVCGVEAWFGPLPAGTWQIFCNESGAGFSGNFTVSP